MAREASTTALVSSRPTWVRAVAGGSELELSPGADPAAILTAVLGRGHSVTRFEVVEPSLEALFIEHVGRPADEPASLAPEVATSSLQAGGVA